ncbi:MAG: hypothetical protein RLZZ47_1533, partial [Bacteroidota bacterium]
IVTSLTDSPGAGTLISIAITFTADLPNKVRQRIWFLKIEQKSPVLPGFFVLRSDNSLLNEIVYIHPAIYFLLAAERDSYRQQPYLHIAPLRLLN